MPTKSQFKKGQSVKIFSDPLTETKLEGGATLLKFRFADDNLENWFVRFASDGFVCDRFIKRPSSLIASIAEEKGCSQCGDPTLNEDAVCFFCGEFEIYRRRQLQNVPTISEF